MGRAVIAHAGKRIAPDANDFGYIPAVARNVSVDIRFFLWLLRDVQKADSILRELGR